MAHTCHAIGCKKVIPPRLLFCFHHWQLVPLPLKLEVMRHYRPGQERDKDPTPAYLEVARKAIDAVAEREGKR